MNRLHPKTLLLILIGIVPVTVAAAGVAAVLLQRAGYGLFIWAILPVAVALLFVAVIGIVLGRAASNWRGSDKDRAEPGKSRNGHDV